jgi:hypothetical protein
MCVRLIDTFYLHSMAHANVAEAVDDDDDRIDCVCGIVSSRIFITVR